MIERLTFLGLPNCYQLSNGTVNLIVSTEVGPRLLYYGFCGAENMLGEYPDLSTPTELGDWKPWGGHRLWVAPEEMPQSYAPDNSPIGFDIVGEDGIHLMQPTDKAGFEKEMTIELAQSGTQVSILHRLTNRNHSTLRVVPWAITILRGGGVTLIPQEPFRSHDDCLVPARSIVLWYFTDLNDPRLTLGPKFLRLRTDKGRPHPQKIGAANRQGWCAYHHDATGMLLVKTFSCKEGATYPDFGANVETYSAGDYMEVETLGPLQDLQPGASTEHTELWHLFRGVKIGTSDDEIEAAILPLLRGTAEH
jgi:hypothetical protein